MRKALWILMSVAFVDMLGFAMIFPLLPFYALRLGGQAWIVGPLVASFSIAQLASSPVWGRVSDRYGRRPVMLIGLTGAGIAYLIFGFANSIWLLFASRIVQGLGGGTTGVVQAYVSDATNPAQRARGLGWLSASTNAGVMIGPAIGSLASHLGPAAPGIVAASLCALNVAFAWAFLPESKPSHARGAKTGIRAAVLRVVRHPTAPQPRLIWIYAVGMGAFASLSAVVALYLKARFGVTEHTIGYFFLYMGLLAVVLRAVIIGWLVDRYGETRVMRAGTVMLALGMLLYPLPRSIPVMGLVLALVPIGTALLFPAVTALVSHETDPTEVGQTMGVQQAFGGVARVVGPMWATPVFQLAGPSYPFLISAVIVAFTGVLAYRVPVRRDAPAAAPAAG
ncbi:MAG TPA: MFS transporter [Gemmatimonadales bacterium]|nr:MFS transporter [Gemmatimonadales bacterium]